MDHEEKLFGELVIGSEMNFETLKMPLNYDINRLFEAHYDLLQVASVAGSHRPKTQENMTWHWHADRNFTAPQI